MTAEEVFCELSDKYGDDFNWHMLPLSNHTFTAELKKEIGNRHFLYHKQIWAVAKCDSNDDVLYLADSGEGTDIYYIFHLILLLFYVYGYHNHFLFLCILIVNNSLP